MSSKKRNVCRNCKHFAVISKLNGKLEKTCLLFGLPTGEFDSCEGFEPINVQ